MTDSSKAYAIIEQDGQIIALIAGNNMWDVYGEVIPRLVALIKAEEGNANYPHAAGFLCGHPAPEPAKIQLSQDWPGREDEIIEWIVAAEAAAEVSVSLIGPGDPCVVDITRARRHVLVTWHIAGDDEKLRQTRCVQSGYTSEADIPRMIKIRHLPIGTRDEVVVVAIEAASPEVE